MRRRDFITGLGIAATLPAMSRAQQEKPTIGFLSTRSPGEAATHTNAFRRGLEEMGYAEGRSVSIEYRWAKGDYASLPSLAVDLGSLALSAIVAAGDPAARAVKAAGLSPPLVFLVGEDPVRAGLVTSMNRPGVATGVNFFTGDLSGKRLELLCAMVPSANVIGLLVNPRFGRDAVEQHRQAVATAVKALGRELVVQESVYGCGDRNELREASEGRNCRVGRAERSVLRLPSKPDIDALIESSTARHLPHSRISGRWRANELRRQSL